ncbi:hypothetical protein F2P79_023000 [Pimephales promelas]|nr:hypothetical protein F2P79_023000 [Pimephales promelas]
MPDTTTTPSCELNLQRKRCSQELAIHTILGKPLGCDPVPRIARQMPYPVCIILNLNPVLQNLFSLQPWKSAQSNGTSMIRSSKPLQGGPEGWLYEPSACRSLLVGQHVPGYLPIRQKCSACAITNTPRKLPEGKLVPLPIPRCPWSHLGIDFMTDLPSPRPVNSSLSRAYPPHSNPQNSCSNKCGRPFSNSSVNLPSGYHPQTNGQTERKIQETNKPPEIEAVTESVSSQEPAMEEGVLSKSQPHRHNPNHHSNQDPPTRSQSP